MAQHALLGASKAHQWLNCTPSAVWELEFPESLQSDAAAEGTLAHRIAEERLRQLLAGKKPKTSAKLRDDPLYHPAMEEHVDTYVGYVMERYAEAKKTTPDAQLLIELRVDFSFLVPEGFGTGDAVLIADGLFEIFDLKYGKGVSVEAEGNPQIRLYALGAMMTFSDLYDMTNATMHIVQPRLDSITSESMTANALMQWGMEYVRPRAALAAKGEGEFCAGEHCRWCRCKNVCRAYAEKQLEVAAMRFAEPEHVERLPPALSMEEIAQVLLSVDELVRWAKSVKDYALDQAVNHEVVIPGWKVVEGRSNRTITDESIATRILLESGYTAEQIMALKGLGELEELVGKKKLAEHLETLIIKPMGKPVLAREDDKRPALSSFENAKKVFTEEESDG